MENWIVTGISGSGRIELLNEIFEYAKNRDKNIIVHDVGALIAKECELEGMPVVDKRILDIDHYLLQALRASALKEVQIQILKNQNVDLHLIGIHGVFRWKERLIPGVSFSEIANIKVKGFMNIVDNVKEIFNNNKKNPKWNSDTLPNLDQTQQWIMEEEFVTQILADVMKKPMYVIARQHNVNNLFDLFFTNKKKIYLSYPITAVRKANPKLLEEIQGSVLKELEKQFIVFNPLAIKDMTLLYKESKEVPDLLEQLNFRAKSLIKTRTIERDFRFIDQSDAVVVFYMTEKVSPGVLAEIYYAHRNQKPVFVVFPYPKSPFLEDATTHIEKGIEGMMKVLEEYAKT